MVVSPDGQRIVTASDDHTARIWDSADGRLLTTLRGHTDVIYEASFSPDGQHIVTASLDRSARLWNAADGHLLAILVGHTGPVCELNSLPMANISSPQAPITRLGYGIAPTVGF